MGDVVAGLEYLTVLGEIFVALAGFTGIVAVLGQRSEGQWRPIDVIRFQIMLEGSLAGLLFAIAPFVFYFFEFPVSLIWSVGSGVLAAYVASLILRAITKQRKLSATSDPDFVPGLRQVLVGLSIPVLIIMFMTAFGVVVDRGFASYFLGLAFLLVLCCAMFMLLLRFIRLAP